MDKLLLFGGSFNPIHNGHLIVSRHVAEQLGTGRVILIPSANPPHKAVASEPASAPPRWDLAAPAHRLAMCRLAVEGDEQFEVDDWEINQPGPNYTLHTVRHFRQLVAPGAELYWLIGMDSLRELVGWYRAGELVEACTIVTVARPGFVPPERSTLEAYFSPAQVQKLLDSVINGPQIDIRGTDIRQRVAAGRSIRYLVPDPVRQYIDRHGLYRHS